MTHSLVLGIVLPVCFAAHSAYAQSSVFTELGALDSPSSLAIDVNLRAGNDIQWFHVVLPAVNDESGFIDIYTWPSFVGDFMRYPGIGLYSSEGDLVAVARHVDGRLQAQLSFGMHDPRPAPPLPDLNDPDNPYPPFAGQEGPLPGGEYWLAVGNYALFLPDNFRAYSTAAPADPHRYTLMYIRVQPPGFPFCDADLNWDGNVDQEDVVYLINVLAGGENPTGRFPDINRDGNEDMDDLAELIDRIAGGGCP